MRISTTARQTVAMHRRRRHLQLITEAKPLLNEGGQDGFARVVAAMRAGVDSVQIREHGATAKLLLEAAQLLLIPASETGTAVIINDRADVALAMLSARRATPGGCLVPIGVHLGGQSLPVDLVRRHLPLPLVGVSVHSLDEARSASQNGAGYLTFGHIYPSNSHPGSPPRGTGQLADVVAAVDIPVFAIGGIDTHNVEDVLATGCEGIAVISAILNAPDPALATSLLRAALDRAST